MNIAALIVQAVGGAIGANAMGKLIKGIDMGVVVNSIAGIVGGGLGGQLLNMAGFSVMPSGSLDLVSILGNVACGGVGGGVLMAIVGFIGKLFKK